MKKVTLIIFYSAVAFLVSCSKKHDPVVLVLPKETGSLQVTVNLGEVSKLRKSMKTADIEMTSFSIVLSADDQSSVYDTFALTGGSHKRTERKTYPGIVAAVDGNLIEWTLYAEARDQNGSVIHSGDTAFTLLVNDTVDIALFLDAQYSMLVANYFPIRDSVTRCVLQVDGYTKADSGFPAQAFVGDTVMMSFDYLTASHAGIAHIIGLLVYGDIAGSEMLLYSGDTDIIVRSGEEANYTIMLSYVGPTVPHGAADMVVTLGKVGKAVINGILYKNDKYSLTLISGGNGSVRGPDSAVCWIPYTITATPDTGYHFSVWQVTSGKAAIADSMTASTALILENGDVTVQGIFKAGYTFRKTFGGKYEDWGNSVQQTDEGGYILVGTTMFGYANVYLAKTYTNGDTAWTKTLGGFRDCGGSSVQQTTDGGYIITGEAQSLDGNYNFDVNLIKTNADGDTVWTRTFGEAGFFEDGNSVQQTSDGGFIIVGNKWSASSLSNIYLIKTTVKGDTVWTRTFGGSKDNYGNFVQQTTEGGYIICGSNLIKTDMNGNELWRKGISGNSVRQTPDGGYIVCGSNLIKTDMNGNELWRKGISGNSVWQTAEGGYIVCGSNLIKTDMNGNELWRKGIGGNSVQQTNDGGYIITGTINEGISYDGEVTYPVSDIGLIKTDENGNFSNH